MGIILASVFVPLLLPQNPAAVPLESSFSPVAVASTLVPAPLDSGLVILAPGTPAGRGFRLGDGGIGAIDLDNAALRGGPGECITPGGVVVEARKEGVKLTFPSGREVLMAPDGYVHLRDGSAAGPFEGGLELRLQDGSQVRVDRGGSRRTPITEVTVATDAGTSVRLWRRSTPVYEPARGDWNGDRVFCMGDGGALYRALAIGPVVTLCRVLAPRQAVDLPEVRLALQAEPLLQSLDLLLEARARISDQAAIAQVRLVLANGPLVLPADGAPPPRTQSSPLQFLLRAGYDLSFAVAGGDVSMTLARHEQRPFVEWRLGYGAAVRCVEAGLQGPGNLVSLPPVAPELQPRLERLDLPRALAVLQRLAGDARKNRR